MLPASRTVAPVVIVLLALTADTCLAQLCNPVVDGTYCAEQGARAGEAPARRLSKSGSMEPIQSIASDLSAGRQEQIGTFGGIAFHGNGTTCIGLLRRGTCK